MMEVIHVYLTVYMPVVIQLIVVYDGGYIPDCMCDSGYIIGCYIWWWKYNWLLYMMEVIYLTVCVTVVI